MVKPIVIGVWLSTNKQADRPNMRGMMHICYIGW